MTSTLRPLTPRPLRAAAGAIGFALFLGTGLITASAASEPAAAASTAAALPMPTVGSVCSVNVKDEFEKQCWENSSAEVVQFSLAVTEKASDDPAYIVRDDDGTALRRGRLNPTSHLHLAPGEVMSILKPSLIGTNTAEITGITPN